MIGRRTATAVCWFFVVRANSEKLPKCGLGAQLASFFEALAAVDLFGFVQRRAERNGLAVGGYLFEPGRTALSQHVVCFGNPHRFLFPVRFHHIFRCINPRRCCFSAHTL